MQSPTTVTTSAKATAGAATQHPSNNDMVNKQDTLHVIFLHLDLGIGGAEQLVLQLATACDDLGYEFDLVTTRCDADHCFAAVQPPHGKFCQRVHVWGRWIPASLWNGTFTALCSHVRMLYLALWVCLPVFGYLARLNRHSKQKAVDLIVVDVLPTPLVWLRSFAPHVATLFYCHFPDQLLVRGTDLNSFIEQANDQNQSGTNVPTKKGMYRNFMDALEQATIPLADVLVVNSNFTKHVVQRVFPTLTERDLHVLYPALDTDALDSKFQQTVNTPDKESSNDHSHKNNHGADQDQDMENTAMDTCTNSSNDDEYIGGPVTIVSLNRYERKKNIELVLEAFALLQQDQQYDPNAVKLVIAGGYDGHNLENVQYRAELEHLAFDTLQLHRRQVEFQVSISDAQRTRLLQHARCVVYTPSHEHFGIVPLEVMYAGTPVIACRSGGPLETVIDGVTGFLCEPTPTAFANALEQVLNSPAKAQTMGRAGRQHVVDKFGKARLNREWQELTHHAVQQGKQRQRCEAAHRTLVLIRALVYLVEAGLLWIVVVAATFLLGWLAPNISIVGRDEL